MLPRLRSAEYTFQRAMAPIFNFFTMIYIDDIIICFETDKEYLFKIFDRNKFGKQDSKWKSQGEHELFDKFWKNPGTVFSNGDNYVFYLQDLNEKGLLVDPVDDRVIKYHGCLDF